MSRPTTVAFLCVYTAAMGSMVVTPAPILGGLRPYLIQYFLLPLASWVIGMDHRTQITEHRHPIWPA
jgi:hypothetical protein